MRAVSLSIAVLAVLLGPATASAHLATVSYSQVQVGDDGSVAYTLRLSSRDLLEALALDRDRDATDGEITGGADRLFDYVLRGVRLSGDRGPCAIERQGVSVLHQTTDRFAELHFVARCPMPLSVLSIDYALFFDLDPSHAGMLRISSNGHTFEHEFAKGDRHYELRIGATAASEGFRGFDHLAFLVGLLLLVPLTGGVRAGVRIVGAFVAACACGVVAGRLGVALPTRFVECATAASIVYVAVENIAVSAPRGRWALAAGFGLAHGLGLSGPAPRLALNAGILLATAAVLLPLLTLLARRDSAAYRRWVVVGGSVVLAAFGVLWTVRAVRGG